MSAHAWAEEWLRHLLTLTDADILHDDHRIAEVMLARPADMRPVYSELARKIASRERREYVLHVLLTALTVCTPRGTSRIADARRESEKLNALIKKKLFELCELMRQRFVLVEEHGLLVGDDAHVVDWIVEGLKFSDARTRGRCQTHILPKLQELRRQYDLKYWPTPVAVLEGLLELQEQPDSSDPLISAALKGYKGNASAVRAITQALISVDAPAITNRSIASLLNVAGLEIDEETVKRYRTRARTRKSGTF